MAAGDNVNGYTASPLALNATFDIKPAGANDQYNIKNIGYNGQIELYYVDGAVLTLFYSDTTTTGGAIVNADFRLTATHYIQAKAKAASVGVSWDGFQWK